MNKNKSDQKTYMNRREFVGSSMALAAMGMVPQVFAAGNTLKIGLNVPMTGDYAAWGLPGVFGCQIIADNENAKGGVQIGGKKYKIEIVSYDHAYDTEKALQGFKKLSISEKSDMIMMLGGSTVAAITPFATRRKVVTSTLLPSDITTDTPYLIAPCEVHPLYNVTGVEWLADKFPDAKTAVIITTNDIEYGKQSAATYQAAFEVRGIKTLQTEFHGYDVADYAPIVGSLLAKKPDIFCLATDVYTTPIIEQLYQQGYKGKIISCTLDAYHDVIAKTSKAFVEGLIFQFPDFDDPALAGKPFPDAAKFFKTFEEKHPGSWSAVAWEYPSILVAWLEAAQAAGSIDSQKVLNKLLSQSNPKNTFGPAQWWGKELWGRDLALVGDWPIVTIQNGKAKIVEYRSVLQWLKKHNAVLKKKMQALDLRTV